MASQGDHKPGSVGKGATVEEYDKPKLVVADGLLVMPGALQHWEKIMSFQARPDDTFIASYPKSAVETINNLPSPRDINIHSPISHISKSILEKKCKVICVLRNPKDVAVSYYHFHTFNNMLPNPGTWSEFLQNFMIGKVGFSSWFDHVKGWWSLRKQPNIFFLFYEAMKKDLGYEAGRLASFLGRDLSPEAMKNLVEQLSFNSMKANMDDKFPNVASPAGFSFKQFLRKGQVGDWKNHFTVAQNEVMDQLIADQLKGTSLDFFYEL
uniref:sulfotransferase 1C2-like isoform X2 n=1 Tax=Myxine glutinosa TaxID=7769 RepID=UPI00358F3A07